MKIKAHWLLVLVMMIAVAAPAYANEVVQIWHCEMNADTTEEQVEALAQKWLDGARKMEGGEKFDVKVFHPVAVTNTGDTDFLFIVIAPSFTDWGKFWDAYDDESPTAKVDAMHQDTIVCPDSALWESVTIKTE